MKRCSVSLIIQGNAKPYWDITSHHQDDHYQKNKCWRGCGETGTLVHCSWLYKTMQLLWKTVQRYLKKLKRESPYDPAIPHLGIYPKELKTGSQTVICTSMFIEVLFTIAKRYKHPSIKRKIDEENMVVKLTLDSAGVRGVDATFMHITLQSALCIQGFNQLQVV